MLSSLYSAVSGIQANGNEISVIGNNIANSNTTGFKSSRASFENIMSTTLGGGSGSQVGRGVLTGSIMPIISQSSFDTTSSPTDMAIDGTGFFVVKDKGGKSYYTRAGDFIFNKNGKLISPSGYTVQGWAIDEKTGEATGDIKDIDISSISSSSKATSKITLGANLDSTYETKFVINSYNDKIVVNDGTGAGAKTYTIENGVYTGSSLAEKIQSKLGISDFTVTFDNVTGKFNFTNNSGNTVTLNTTDPDFSMGEVLGLKIKDLNGDGSYTSADNISIATGSSSKSSAIPELTTKSNKITTDNNKIIFEEDGTQYTATIATGNYSLEEYVDSTTNTIKTPLGKAIEDALNNAVDSNGANPKNKYTIDFDKDTGKFKINATNNTATDSTVKFYWGDDTVSNDPGADTTAEQILGFVKKTFDNQNNPNVKNSFTLNVPANGSSYLTSLYAPDTVFDNSTYDYSSTMNVFDTLGNPHNVTLYFKKVAENYWEWHATVSGDELDGGLKDDDGNPQVYEVGNGGYLSFNSSGSLREATGLNDLYFNFSGGAKSLQKISLDFGTSTLSGGSGLDGVTQFASSSTTFSQSQDGYGSGTLTGYSVSSDGIISGIYTNGEIKGLAKLALAKFKNPWGLSSTGKNLFEQTIDSGDAIIGAPNTGGRGKIVASALERSNVDIAEQFVKLISAQRAYQANSRVITTSDQLLMEVVNLKR